MHATYIFSLLKLIIHMYLTKISNNYPMNFHLSPYHTTNNLVYAHTIPLTDKSTLYYYNIIQHNIHLYKKYIYTMLAYIIHNIMQNYSLFYNAQKSTGFVTCFYSPLLSTRIYAIINCNSLSSVSKHIIKNHPTRNVSIRTSLNKIQQHTK